MLFGLSGLLLPCGSGWKPIVRTARAANIAGFRASVHDVDVDCAQSPASSLIPRNPVLLRAEYLHMLGSGRLGGRAARPWCMLRE